MGKAGAGPQAAKNERLTGMRREVKYLLSPIQAKAMMHQFAKRLPRKAGDRRASDYRVSVYLDTPERRLSRCELNTDPLSQKLRIRDYYDLAGDVPIFGTFCFFETKLRVGDMVEKTRFPMPREMVPRILDGTCRLRDVITPGPDFADFENICRNDLLMPLFIVHYRRFTLQDNAARLRITFDDRLSYHTVCPDTLGTLNWCRRHLPPPIRLEPMYVVEVKSVGSPPSWVGDLLHNEQASDYSKFGVGVRELVRRGLMEIPPDGTNAVAL